MAYPSFHNSDGSITKEEVADGTKVAGKQEAAIMAFYRASPHLRLTPPEVQDQSGLGHCPLTSIRRALTTLTRKGLLQKYEVRKRGRFGMQNCTWGLPEPKDGDWMFNH